MALQPSDLSIIIVNWNSKEFLRKCLVSVDAGQAGECPEVVVVDNASFDGCDQMLRREFPSVRFIQSDKNLGFGMANNLGAQNSAGRNLLFLNPDTEVVGSALPILTSFMNEHQDVGIAGPKLLNSDLSIQLESIRAFPSLVNQTFDSYYLKSRFPRLSMWGMRPLFDDCAAPVPVDVVSGASLMIKRKVFEQIGGFSPQYFMYSEDVDLCYRVRQIGWKVYFVGRAEVVHHGGGSSALAPVSQFAAVLTRESRFRFLRSARGRGYACLFRSMTAVNALSRLAVLVVSFPLLRMRREAVAGTIGKWVHVLRWALGLERWAKAIGNSTHVN
jgi:GT2 family glycosyltransferase